MKYASLILFLAMSTMMGCTKNVVTFKIFPRSETPNFENSDAEFIAQVSAISKTRWDSSVLEQRNIKIRIANTEEVIVGSLDISFKSAVEPKIDGHWSTTGEPVFTAVVFWEADDVSVTSRFELRIE